MNLNLTLQYLMGSSNISDLLWIYDHFSANSTKHDPELIFTNINLFAIIMYSILFIIAALANLANIIFIVSLNSAATYRSFYHHPRLPRYNNNNSYAKTGGGLISSAKSLMPDGLSVQSENFYNDSYQYSKLNRSVFLTSPVTFSKRSFASLKDTFKKKTLIFASSTSYFRMRTLLLNLCIADLFVAFLLIPLEISWRITVKWMAGDIACRLLMFVRIFGLYLSSFVLVCIAIDRYMSILHPLSVRYAERRQKGMMIACWVASFLCSLPQSIIFHVTRHPDKPDFTQCVTFYFFANKTRELTYNIFCMVAMYGGPLLIIFVLYMRVLYRMHQSTRALGTKDKNSSISVKIKTLPHSMPRRESKILIKIEHSTLKNGKNIKVINKDMNCGNVQTQNFNGRFRKLTKKYMDHSNNKSSQSNSPASTMTRHFDFSIIKRAQNKNLKLTIYIIIAFVFCWTPFYTMAMLFWFDPEKASKTNIYIQEALFLFAVSNSCINPLIYGRFVFITLKRSKKKTGKGAEKYNHGDRLNLYTNEKYNRPYNIHNCSMMVNRESSMLSVKPMRCGEMHQRCNTIHEKGSSHFNEINSDVEGAPKFQKDNIIYQTYPLKSPRLEAVSYNSLMGNGEIDRNLVNPYYLSQMESDKIMTTKKNFDSFQPVKVFNNNLCARLFAGRSRFNDKSNQTKKFFKSSQINIFKLIADHKSNRKSGIPDTHKLFRHNKPYRNILLRHSKKKCFNSNYKFGDINLTKSLSNKCLYVTKDPNYSKYISCIKSAVHGDKLKLL